MRTPGYTANLSLRPAIGQYGTTFTSHAAQGMVAPQMDAVIIYDSWYGTNVALGGGLDPYGSSIGSPTLSGQLKCIKECGYTLSSCMRWCRSLPVHDRGECFADCHSFYDSCSASC
jgi:hypothetical protein